MCVLDVLALLERLGSDRTKLKEAVLIGCSEQNQVQFCLDVGKNSVFTLPGSGTVGLASTDRFL